MIQLGLAEQFASTCIGIRFITWGMERKFELGEQPKPRARTIRWSIVLGSLLLGYVPGEKLWALRVLAGIVGVAFACWPNFSNRVWKQPRVTD
jgi:hypothetical protein